MSHHLHPTTDQIAGVHLGGDFRGLRTRHSWIMKAMASQGNARFAWATLVLSFVL